MNPELVCLKCTLPFGCDQEAKGCKFTQITRLNKRVKKRNKREAVQMKIDMLAILNLLVEQKAIDHAFGRMRILPGAKGSTVSTGGKRGSGERCSF